MYQPVYILSEGSQQSRGSDSRSRNIAAAIAVADLVRSTLGPRGLDKMLVEPSGDIVITNDGATILDLIDPEVPAAKAVVQAAKAQDQACFDGTTSVVVLAAELLRKSQDLLDNHVHAGSIASGYRLGMDYCLGRLEELSLPLAGKKPKTRIEQVARTAMTGKSAAKHRDLLAALVVEAVEAVVSDGAVFDHRNIQIIKQPGGSVADSDLHHGIILEKERVHPAMPRRVEDARLLLIQSALEVKKTSGDARIEVTTVPQMQAFLNEEESMLTDMISAIEESGASVVVCQKGIDDLVKSRLAQLGIVGLARVKKSQLELLSRATAGTIVTQLSDLSPENLGDAGLVEQRSVGGTEFVFIENCPDARAVALLLRAGTEHVCDELARILHDALGVVGLAADEGAVLSGGGASWVNLSLQLREHASGIPGRAQLAVEAMAQALEVIPRTIARNCGYNEVDILIALRQAHRAGKSDTGVDITSGGVSSMIEAGVFEPVTVVRQALKSAVETAGIILRIDEVISARRSSGGGPGGPE